MPSRPPPGPVDPPEPTAAAIPHHYRHHPILVTIVAAAAVFTFLAIATALLVVLLCRRLARGGASSNDTADLKSPPQNPLRRFSYSQLRRATASFSPSHKLGQGGFGSVFRGVLPSGQEIAVKLMDFGSLQGEREFQNELALAGKMLAMGSLSDREWVVTPLGYCSSEEKRRCRRWWWRRPMEADEDEDEEVEVEASATGGGTGRRLLLVYELMHNGSLQDALLDRRCPELMVWDRRFSVALDIARGLQFLHAVCDPPVIHGDIKPSNILLDARLSAKIADFGLARLKTPVTHEAPTATAAPASNLGEDEVVIEIDLDEAAAPDSKSVSNDRKKEPALGGGEDDGSFMGETAESTMTTVGFEEMIGYGGLAPETSPGEDEDFTTASLVETAAALNVPSTSETGVGFDKSVDRGKETAASISQRGGRKKSGVGKDWWRRQDTGGGANSESGGRVKDYVMEWIGSEIKKERPKSDWIRAQISSADDCLPKQFGAGRLERKKRPRRRRMEWWALLDEENSNKKEKSRRAREWWREEFCEELMNKQKRRAIDKSKGNTEKEDQQGWQKDEDLVSPSDRRKRRTKSWSRGSRTGMDGWTEGINGEMRTTRRRSSQDWASGDIPNGTVSSTPSMRGTVCYAAPECGVGGPLSQECDIYSFGVLLLVLVSGRRPLQVTASPMSEFERANLISWARHLAHLGRLLDLVDPSLGAVDGEQALLCITVALLCLQRSPARRPSIKLILGMLTGQSEPPHLPLEFSPPSPGGFPFRSRKKARPCLGILGQRIPTQVEAFGFGELTTLSGRAMPSQLVKENLGTLECMMYQTL